MLTIRRVFLKYQLAYPFSSWPYQFDSDDCLQQTEQVFVIVRLAFRESPTEERPEAILSMIIDRTSALALCIRNAPLLCIGPGT